MKTIDEMKSALIGRVRHCGLLEYQQTAVEDAITNCFDEIEAEGESVDGIDREQFVRMSLDTMDVFLRRNTCLQNLASLNTLERNDLDFCIMNSWRARNDYS